MKRGIPEANADSCFEHSDIRILNLFRVSYFVLRICYGYRISCFGFVAPAPEYRARSFRKVAAVDRSDVILSATVQFPNGKQIAGAETAVYICSR